MEPHLNQLPFPVVATLDGVMSRVPLRPQVLKVRVAGQARGVSERPHRPRDLDGVSGKGWNASDLVHGITANALNEFSPSERHVRHPAVVHRNVRHFLFREIEEAIEMGHSQPLFLYFCSSQYLPLTRYESKTSWFINDSTANYGISSNIKYLTTLCG